MIYGTLVIIGQYFLLEKIEVIYEEPMHTLAKATKQVANGDFSVYIPTIHTSDKWNYLDVMITDFNVEGI